MTTTPAPVYGGRYELRSQIARGGTAQVYLARDLLLDRPVALKVLFPELSTDHTFVERFRREAQAAANLMHPNIVQVFDWGESERTYFIVMEYIDGEPLSSIIRSQAPLDPPQAASIAADIAKALSYAHRHGVVHRDIKPGNVLITADGQVKVTDFGIARAIGTDEQVTQTGLVMGTATYFSPEQAQGLAVDARSDVYALGVVLFEMLCARPPFTGETPVAIAYQHVREPAPMPRSINPDIPGALETIVLQAMAKLPADRYATADEMKADLDRFVHGQSVLARPPRDGTTTGPVTTVMPLAGAGGGVIDDTTAVVSTEAGRPKRAKSTTPWWLTGGVMLLVAIGLVVYFGGRSLGYFGGTSDISVPKVTGDSLTTAEDQLKQAGLNSTVAHQLPVTALNIAKANTVAAQSPASGLDVKPGTKVSLTIYGNARLVTVTNETGTSQSTAYTALTKLGFVAKVVYGVGPNVNAKIGFVYKQAPSGGKQPFGDTITLYVADAQKQVKVPDVSGDTQSAATTKLIASGFSVNTTTTDSVVSTITVGDVAKTIPAAGTKAAPGTAVILVLSKGALTVPQGLVGDTPSQAESILTGEGLLYRTPIQNNVDPDQVGFVVGVEPKPGTTVPSGFQVVLFIGAQDGSTSTSTSTSTTTSTTTTTTSTTTTTTGPPTSSSVP